MARQRTGSVQQSRRAWAAEETPWDRALHTGPRPHRQCSFLYPIQSPELNLSKLLHLSKVPVGVMFHRQACHLIFGTFCFTYYAAQDHPETGPMGRTMALGPPEQLSRSACLTTAGQRTRMDSECGSASQLDL